MMRVDGRLAHPKLIKTHGPLLPYFDGLRAAPHNGFACARVLASPVYADTAQLCTLRHNCACVLSASAVIRASVYAY